MKDIFLPVVFFGAVLIAFAFGISLGIGISHQNAKSVRDEAIAHGVGYWKFSEFSGEAEVVE
jgi:hypothetical protein